MKAEVMPVTAGGDINVRCQSRFPPLSPRDAPLCTANSAHASTSSPVSVPGLVGQCPVEFEIAVAAPKAYAGGIALVSAGAGGGVIPRIGAVDTEWIKINSGIRPSAEQQNTAIHAADGFAAVGFLIKAPRSKRVARKSKAPIRIREPWA